MCGDHFVHGRSPRLAAHYWGGAWYLGIEPSLASPPLRAALNLMAFGATSVGIRLALAERPAIGGTEFVRRLAILIRISRDHRPSAFPYGNKCGGNQIVGIIYSVATTNPLTGKLN